MLHEKYEGQNHDIPTYYKRCAHDRQHFARKTVCPTLQKNKTEQSGQFHVKTGGRGRKKKVRKAATSSMKIQPHFLKAADRLDTVTSARLVVSFQPVSNVILGSRITCSTTVLSLVTNKAFRSFSPVVP